MDNQPTLKQLRALAGLVYSKERSWSWIKQEKAIEEVLGEKVKLANVTKSQLITVIGELKDQQQGWLKEAI